MNEGKYFINIFCKSGIFHTFTSLNNVNGAHRPGFFGLFLCPLQYGGGTLRGSKTSSPVDGFSSVSATAFLLAHIKYIIAMLSKSTSATGTSIGVFTPEELIKDLIISDPVRQLLRIGIKPFKYSPNE